MKSGTTSLAAWLSLHPDVFIPAEKETRFFNDPERHALGLDWYEAQFAAAGGATAIGDATPLMSNPVAVDRMSELLPDAIVIVSLRDPVDRAYSHYQHLLATGEERRSFAEALSGERSDPLAARGNPPRDYLHRSHYLPQVRRILDRYPDHQVRFLEFGTLTEHPRWSCQTVLAAIGVDPARLPADLGGGRNPRPGWRAPSVERWLRDHGHRLPGPVVRAARRLNSATARDYRPLPPGERARLTAEFAEEVPDLQRLTGLDLRHWLPA